MTGMQAIGNHPPVVIGNTDPAEWDTASRVLLVDVRFAFITTDVSSERAASTVYQRGISLK
jgi:hypothetical protein